MTFRLVYAAISDVGRVRKVNQDSAYAGPWLLAVCDGVGGAVRGDLASSTAIDAIRKIDEPPPADGQTDDDLLSVVANALHRAHDRISELVDDDPNLNGTSTTATVTLFDGARLGVGHVGDSRAYLLRKKKISQLTTDHTFVQTLIDEGRISEEEARVHPHRHLIMRAIDGLRDVEHDLFIVDLVAGDRMLLCSDGASGVLDDGRLADILSTGSPDFAAVELVRASLEAGSSDNVTCLVADVAEAPADAPADAPAETTAGGADGQAPMLVGAAADLKRKGGPRGNAGARLFRGHRSGDTGELEPVVAELPEGATGAIDSDPTDAEAARYAPRPPRRFPWARRLLVLLGLVGVLWMVGAVAWHWSQQQYYVGEHDGKVTIYRGVNADIPGLSLAHPYEASNLPVSSLNESYQRRVNQGMDARSLSAAERAVTNLAQAGASPGGGG
ncbi:MAG: PP2C family protein-serine/threonine phosphatase [Nocardioides sp.]